MKKVLVLVLSLFLSLNIISASGKIDEPIDEQELVVDEIEEVIDQEEIDFEEKEELELEKENDNENITVEETLEEPKEEIQDVVKPKGKEIKQKDIQSEFNLTDWNYEIVGDTIVIEDKAYDFVKDVYIPGEAEKDGVMYNVAFKSLFALRNVNKVVVEEVNGKKVKVNDTSFTMPFRSNNGVTYVDLRGLDVSNFTSLKELFYMTPNLKTIDISGWDTSQVTDMSHMFNGTSSITTLNMTGLDTSNVINMESMFASTGLTTLDFSLLDTSSAENMNLMFYNSSIMNFDVSGFDMSNVVSVVQMFSSLKNTTSLDLSSWNTNKFENTSSLFSGSKKLSSINMDGWNTSNVKDMGSMFSNLIGMEALDLNHFDVSNVTTLTRTFAGMKNLKTLGVDQWDVSSVEYMDNTFSDTEKLEVLDLSNWKLKGINTFRSTFENTGVKELDLSNFNTKGIWQMTDLFKNAKNLEKLNVTGWDITDIAMTSNMFSGASSLKELDLSTWDFKNIIYMNNMFTDTDSLELINFGDSKFTELQSATDLYKTTNPTKLLVISSDPKIASHDFAADNRIPVAWTGIEVDAKDGKFADNSSTKFLDNKVNDYVMKSNLVTQDELEAFLLDTPVSNDNTKTFVRWTPELDTLTYPINILDTTLKMEAVYGIERTVTFVLDNQETIVKLLDGELIDEDDIPTLVVPEGFTFKGWFNEGETTAFDFTTPVTSNLKLTAKFEKISFTVSLKIDGITHTIDVDYGDTIHETLLPTIPEKEGFKVVGWMKDGETEVFDFDTVIKDDLTLNATYDKITHTVTLNIDGMIHILDVDYGDTIDQSLLPTIPNKEGYKTIGWTEAGEKNIYDFNTPIKDDLALFATYEKIDDTKPVEPVKPVKPEDKTPPTGISSYAFGYIMLMSLLTLFILKLRKRSVK